MEHRFELENLLLNGLPDQERHHVVKVMRKVATESLRRKQSETVRCDHPISLADLDLAE